MKSTLYILTSQVRCFIATMQWGDTEAMDEKKACALSNMPFNTMVATGINQHMQAVPCLAFKTRPTLSSKYFSDKKFWLWSTQYPQYTKK